MTDRLVIIHGGQSGVDRGAWRAARDAGVRIDGFMPADHQDEYGTIPEPVQASLRTCELPGFASRTICNLQICDAVLVIVADAQRPYATPGTRLTLSEARDRGIVRRVVDSDQPQVLKAIAEVLGLLGPMRRDGVLRLMVAGPRYSKWRGGEATAYKVVKALVELASSSQQVTEFMKGPDQVRVPDCSANSAPIETNVILDPRHDIEVHHNVDWSGDALVVHHGRFTVNAIDLATGEWPFRPMVRLYDCDQAAAARATAMAAAAYSTWIITSSIERS